MRSYDEEIHVRCARRATEEVFARREGAAEGVVAVAEGGSGAAGDGLLVPDAFVRRGRLYVVRRVLDRWVERRAWWRTALDPGRPVRPDAEGGPGGFTPADLEDEVWRVEAAAGRHDAGGVYDLARGAGETDGPWRLLRVGD